MKYLFRIIKILIVSTLTIFLVSVTASYLLLNIPSVQQKVVTGELSALGELALQVESPSLIIVGTVVSLRDKLNWFSAATKK